GRNSRNARLAALGPQTDHSLALILQPSVAFHGFDLAPSLTFRPLERPANHCAEMIYPRHEEEHDDEDRAGLVILKHPHGELDLLAESAGPHQSQDGGGTDSALPAI